MTLTARIYECLPGTAEEVAEKSGATLMAVNDALYRMNVQGRVTRSGKRDTGRRGPKPAVWGRV